MRIISILLSLLLMVTASYAAPKKGIKGARSLATFKKMDTNKNGTISMGEFTAYQKTRFKKKDKNKDGKLTKGEFSPTLKNMKK